MKNKDLTQRGRNSTMVGIRISNEVRGVLLEEAEKRGESVGELVKRKVEAWVESINTKKAEVPTSVEGKAHTEQREYATKVPLSLYNPAVHKAGDRVLVKVGGRLKEAVVPELDGDGRACPELG